MGGQGRGRCSFWWRTSNSKPTPLEAARIVDLGDTNECAPRLATATFDDGNFPHTARGLILLHHKFHLWLRGRWRRQHGHRERAFAIAKASARRIVAIEFGTCRCGRSGSASGSVIGGEGGVFDWGGGKWTWGGGTLPVRDQGTARRELPSAR